MGKEMLKIKLCSMFTSIKSSWVVCHSVVDVLKDTDTKCQFVHLSIYLTAKEVQEPNQLLSSNRRVTRKMTKRWSVVMTVHQPKRIPETMADIRTTAEALKSLRRF